jgi:hypothetical protein
VPDGWLANRGQTLQACASRGVVAARRPRRLAGGLCVAAWLLLHRQMVRPA